MGCNGHIIMIKNKPDIKLLPSLIEQLSTIMEKHGQAILIELVNEIEAQYVSYHDFEVYDFGVSILFEYSNPNSNLNFDSLPIEYEKFFDVYDKVMDIKS
jgi:hypothetical protein